MESLRRQMVHHRERLARTLKLVFEENITRNEGTRLLEKIQQSLDRIFNEMTKVGSNSEIETVSAEVMEDYARIANAVSQLKSNSGNRKSCWDLHRQNLDLRAFDGDITEWPMFFETFQSIHSDSDLSDAEKMRCLKSSLKGEALNLVKHLPLTEQSYQEAWTLLRERYSNRRLIANTFAQKIIALPDVKKGVSLRELLNHFHGAYNALKGFIPDGNLGEILVLNLIINHLDDETVQAWELSLQTTEVPSLKEFLHFLEVRTRALESRRAASSTTPSQQHSNSPVHCKGHHSPSLTEEQTTSQPTTISSTSRSDIKKEGKTVAPASREECNQEATSAIGDNAPFADSSSGSVHCASTSKAERPQSPFSPTIKVEDPDPISEENQEMQKEKKINLATQHGEITQSVDQGDDTGVRASEDSKENRSAIRHQRRSQDSTDEESVSRSSRSRSWSSSSSRKKFKFEDTNSNAEDIEGPNSGVSDNTTTSDIKQEDPTTETFPQPSCQTDSNRENVSISKRRARTTRGDGQLAVTSARRPQPLMSREVLPPNFFSLNYEGWTSLQLRLLLANRMLQSHQ